MMSSWFEVNSTEPPLESSKKPLENNSKSAQKEVGFVISENQKNAISSDHKIQDVIVSQNRFLKSEI